MGPCVDSLALNITISSTDKHLLLGYHGCGETVRDKELFVEGARKAFRSLKRASEPRRKVAARKANRTTKAKPAAKSRDLTAVAPRD